MPVCGGFIVSVLNAARDAVSKASYNAKGALGSFLKAVAACVTLGTGNSLGPEGPSVEIGSSIAKEIHSILDKNPQTKLSLLAAGSAAGISSGSFLFLNWISNSNLFEWNLFNLIALFGMYLQVSMRPLRVAFSLLSRFYGHHRQRIRRCLLQTQLLWLFSAR